MRKIFESIKFIKTLTLITLFIYLIGIERSAFYLFFNISI